MSAEAVWPVGPVTEAWRRRARDRYLVQLAAQFWQSALGPSFLLESPAIEGVSRGLETPGRELVDRRIGRAAALVTDYCG